MKKENSFKLHNLSEHEKKLELFVSGGNDSMFLPKISDERLKEEIKVDYPEAYKSTLEILNKKKEDQQNKLIVENEYTNSLLNMIQNEKINVKNTENSYLECIDKLRKLSLSIKYIESNLLENMKRSKNLTGMKRVLTDDLDKLNRVVVSQTNKLGYVSFSLDKENTEVQKRRKLLEERNISLDREMKFKKEKIKSKIVETEKIKLLKLNNENRVSRIILGLDLIKRYT